MKQLLEYLRDEGIITSHCNRSLRNAKTEDVRRFICNIGLWLD